MGYLGLLAAVFCVKFFLCGLWMHLACGAALIVACHRAVVWCDRSRWKEVEGKVYPSD